MLVLRYSNKIIDSCIEKHLNVLNKDSFVWWGKCGARTSQKNIDLVMNENEPKLLLYSSNDKCYICGLSKVTYEKPGSSYPKYYDEVFDDELFPTTYYKLTSIVELNKQYLSHFIVNSTGRELSDLMCNSMTSQCVSKAIDSFEIGME